MKKNVSKWEAKEFYEFFTNLPKNIGNKHFLLFKFDGIESCKGIHTIVTNLLKSVESEEYLEMEKKKIEIVNTKALRDNFGRVIFSKNGEVSFPEKEIKKVQKEIDKLNEDYKEVIINHDKDFNEIWELTNSEQVEIDVPMIEFENIPEGLSEEETNFIFKNFMKR